MKFISEPEQSFQVDQDKRKSRQVLFETVLLLALVFACAIPVAPVAGHPNDISPCSTRVFFC